MSSIHILGVAQKATPLLRGLVQQCVKIIAKTAVYSGVVARFNIQVT